MSLERSVPAGGIEPADLRAIDDALARLGLSRTGDPAPVENSVRNHNYRTPTAGGDVFARVHRRNRSRDRLEMNLAAQRHAAARGIPVAAPLSAPDGTVLFPAGGRFVSVYPWVEGQTLARGRIDEAGAAALGDMQAQLHIALRDFEHPALGTATELSWDIEQAIADLSRVDDLIRYYPAPSDAQQRVQQNLRAQLAVLEAGAVRPCADFDAVPRQPVHGDYHEGNVLFANDGTVAAVVDWDMAALAPRLFELMRAIDFTIVVDQPRVLDAYLRAYTAGLPYSAEDARIAVEQWAASTLANAWVYTARFIEGDRRVERFFESQATRVRQYSDSDYRARLAATLADHAAG